MAENLMSFTENVNNVLEMQRQRRKDGPGDVLEVVERL